MNKTTRAKLTWSVIIGAGAIAAILLTLNTYLLTAVQIPTQQEPQARAAITIIPANTPTPIGNLGLFNTPTATEIPARYNGIGVGDYVQITGTSGVGLRFRSSAGTDGTPLFLGMEAEVFKVKEGPKDKDGYTWWFLVAPYDEKRSGWAAANYLAVVTTNP
jgi:hypothetical protein